MPRELQGIDRGIATHEAHECAFDIGPEAAASDECRSSPARTIPCNGDDQMA